MYGFHGEKPDNPHSNELVEEYHAVDKFDDGENQTSCHVLRWLCSMPVCRKLFIWYSHWYEYK